MFTSADTLDLIHDDDSVTHYEGGVAYQYNGVGVTVFSDAGAEYHPEVLRVETYTAAENHHAGQALAEPVVEVEADDAAVM